MNLIHRKLSNAVCIKSHRFFFIFGAKLQIQNHILHLQDIPLIRSNEIIWYCFKMFRQTMTNGSMGTIDDCTELKQYARNDFKFLNTITHDRTYCLRMAEILQF